MNLLIKNILILASLFTEVSVTSSPSWPPTGCDFIRHSGKAVFALTYWTDNSVQNIDECESGCGEDNKCGMYVFRPENLRMKCRRFQSSLSLIHDTTGIPEEYILQTYANHYTGSKACPATTALSPCTYTNAESISNFPEITRIMTHSSYDLTPDHCKTFCSYYTNCTKVAYREINSEKRMCYLYSAPYSSSTRLEADNIMNEVYDKICSNNPEESSNTEPAVPKVISNKIVFIPIEETGGDGQQDQSNILSSLSGKNHHVQCAMECAKKKELCMGYSYYQETKVCKLMSSVNGASVDGGKTYKKKQNY